jgi:SAM-dependent methyltransferase
LVSRVPALERAREAAHTAGDYVGQESFMRAGEILELGRRAGIGEGTRVLDLCCGIAGPGRHLAGTLGCSYLGVDRSEAAVSVARERARGLPCEFRAQQVPPVPAGPFDVVLLFETMLAFRDKEPLLHGIAGALEPGGRFACTLEAGSPLTASERDRMPAADTVWLTPLATLRAMLQEMGLSVRWENDLTAAHRETAASLLRAYEANSSAISAEIGAAETDDLLTAHRVWVDWLSSGRARKIALVVQK